MRRLVAELPGSVAELCLVRFGLVARKLGAVATVLRLARSMDRAVAGAIAEGSGLLHADRFSAGWRERGALLYWSGFDAMERWARRPPHADWWRLAVDRMRARGDLGVYHEAYLVPRENLESIYLDCPPIGLARFGVTSEPVGDRTTARDRLGRRASRPAGRS